MRQHILLDSKPKHAGVVADPSTLDLIEMIIYYPAEHRRVQLSTVGYTSFAIIDRANVYICSRICIRKMNTVLFALRTPSKVNK